MAVGTVKGVAHGMPAGGSLKEELGEKLEAGVVGKEFAGERIRGNFSFAFDKGGVTSLQVYTGTYKINVLAGRVIISAPKLMAIFALDSEGKASVDLHATPPFEQEKAGALKEDVTKLVSAIRESGVIIVPGSKGEPAPGAKEPAAASA